MAAEADGGAPAERPAKTKGELYESIAFTFCRCATLLLIFREFALPVTAALATVFYLVAHFHGQSDTRCVLKKPLLIAAFWGVICIAWIAGSRAMTSSNVPGRYFLAETW